MAQGSDGAKRRWKATEGSALRAFARRVVVLWSLAASFARFARRFVREVDCRFVRGLAHDFVRDFVCRFVHGLMKSWLTIRGAPEAAFSRKNCAKYVPCEV